MKLSANLKLKFAIERRPLTVESSTFEKATFDQFLAVSIAAHSNPEEADEYIADLTGKGSLNEHLRKLVEEARNMDEEEKQRILSSSLYPTVHIDNSQCFTYYPLFKKTLLNGELYEGDLAVDSRAKVLNNAVKYTGELKKVTVKEGEEKETVDNYRVILEDDGGEIEIAPNKWVKATPEQLKDIVVCEYSVTQQIEDMAIEAIEGDGWNFLSASFLNGPMKQPRGFFAKEGGIQKYFLITNDCIKETVIDRAYGVYLYREGSRRFDPSNAELCDNAAKHLLSSKELENFKVKSLVALLSACTGKVAEETINYVLSIKSSPELARLAVSLLERGLNRGWTTPALRQMKNAATPKQKELIYKLDSSIFDLEDFLSMDRSILKPSDQEKVKNYEDDRKSKLDHIKDVAGKVATSGLRERVKKLKSTPELKEFNKLVIDLVAHNKTDISKASDEKLDSVYRLANRLERICAVIEEKCKAAEEADE